MNEKKTLVRKNIEGTTRAVSRKRSYRPVQYGLVVASFVASFLGAAWLQSQDQLHADLLAATEPVTSEVAEAPASALLSLDQLTLTLPTAEAATEPLLPTTTPTPATATAATTPLTPTPVVPTPIVPTATPAVQEPTPTTAQPVPSAPRAVARSRSSR